MVAVFLYNIKVREFPCQSSAVDVNKGLCVFVWMACCLVAMSIFCTAMIVLVVKHVWTALLDTAHLVTDCYIDEILRRKMRIQTLYGPIL